MKAKINLLISTLLLTGTLTAFSFSQNSAIFNGEDETVLEIIQQPVSQMVAAGSQVVLQVVATGSDLRYQWFYNGDVLQSQKNSQLTIDPVTAENCGAYEVIVYNSEDADWSSIAHVQLNVPALPFTDNFANRGSITTASGSGRSTTVGATRQDLDPGLRGKAQHSIWITWVAPVSGIAHFDTIGSGFDSGIYVGTLAGTTNLVKVTTDDDSGGYHSAYATFNATAGTAYQIMVCARDDVAGPVLFSWGVETPITPLPTITTFPADLTVRPGTAGSLSVAFTTTGTVNVQWYRNGTKLTGATAKTLSWTTLTEADLGSYEVELSTPDWTWTLEPVQVQFNSEGLTTVRANSKLADSVSSGLIGTN